MEQQGVIRPGMRVLGSDGAEIGSVERVLVSPDGGSARLLLSGGQIRVPTDIISSVDPDKVQLKLSAATARGTAWGDIPAEYGMATSFTWPGGAKGETETTTVQRLEERLTAEKRWVEAGRVQVQKSVVEEPQTVTVDVAHEEYEVQRVAVDRPWQPGDDSPRTEGDTIVVPILSEELVVTRRKVVGEELRLTRRVLTEQQQITDTVRKEVVDATEAVRGDSTP